MSWITNEPLPICFMGGQVAGKIGLETAVMRAQILAAVSYDEHTDAVLRARKIPIFSSIYQPEFVEYLKRCAVLLCVHGRQIVPVSLLALPQCGGINVHPFLDRYKGADPVGRALAAGETRGSVGAHRMTERIDEGEVLAAAATDISGLTTVVEIYQRLYPLYAEVVTKALEMIKEELDNGGS